MKVARWLLALPIILNLTIFPIVHAQEMNLKASEIIPRALVFFSPVQGTFTEGSIFDVSVYINTLKTSINTMKLTVKFPTNKLSIVRPSAGKSLIQLWLEPPSYSNSEGFARFVGVIPNGVKTESGLITTITFKALVPGEATIYISSNSEVLANDGLGTKVETEFGRASFSIVPKGPGGVKIFSETHPFESQWYNNPNPILGWEKDEGVSDFSFVLDNTLATVPDNLPEGELTSVAYENLNDGLHYFHVKARKQGVWGNPSHFLFRIDTTPPAEFKPKAEVLTAAIIFSRVLVSFFTTDSLSGIDHYEVAVIDRTESPNISPVFVQVESPYQLSNPASNTLRVIVRAIDGAGNVRDGSVDVNMPFSIISFLKNYFGWISLVFLILLIILIVLHYLISHRTSRRIKETIQATAHREEIKKNEQETPEEQQGEKTAGGGG